jgi:ribosomal protein S18 acetylase RimI-like enzyme
VRGWFVIGAPDMADAPRLITADLDDPAQRDLVLQLTRDYFRWMDGEIQAAIGLSIGDIVGMDREAYASMILDRLCASRPPQSIFHLAEVGGEIAGMGGLRKLDESSAEIVRIYTVPAFRGRGIGGLMVTSLVEEARRYGYRSVKLDTGSFMRSAQRIYRAAGFEPIAPYPGAEPPAAIEPIWLFMEKRLA